MIRKFFVVSFDDNNMMDFGIPSYRGENRHGFFQPAKEGSSRYNDKEQQSWAFEDLLSATHFANYMAGLHPNIHYGVATVGEVYISKPGPVLGSKFTKEGLLPL